MLFNFQTVRRVVHGVGAIKKLGDEVRSLKGSKVLIVTDKGLAQSPVPGIVEDALVRADVPVRIFSEVEPDPSPLTVEKSAESAKGFQADLIVGVGGGSSLDVAKATALLCKHPGPLEQYFGINLVPSECLPLILIPTTAGTGSEVTSISVLGDSKTNSKKGIVSDELYAKCVLLDPNLTLSLPPHVTAATGLDAFAHAMESFVNLVATPLTDALNLQAMKMISSAIRKAYTNGSDIEARTKMLYAATIAGIGFSNTQNGIIHAPALAVPTQYHLPHGLLISALAPMGIMFNAISAPEKYALVAQILGSARPDMNLTEQAKSAADGFRSLLHDLNIKEGLAAYGVDRSDLPGIAERAVAAKRLMDGNPRKGSVKDVLQLLEENF